MRRHVFAGDRLHDVVAEAWSNLRSQGRRSALALLGIVIGTASIIAMLNGGHMAQRESLKLFAKMGVDMLLVQGVPTGDRPVRLAPQAIRSLAREDPEVRAVIPLALGRGTIRAGAAAADTPLLAAGPELADAANLRVAAGRSLRPLDACAGSAVVGNGLARTLSTPAAAVGPGSRLIVGDYGFTVVGVLAPVTPQSLDPVDYDQAVLTPLDCARRVIAGGGPNALLVRVSPGADTASVAERIRARLATPDATLTILDAQSILETMRAQKAVHSRMLTGVGAVALLVGGIGVMNVMLMSVMERRREVGLRAAIGAAPDDIRALFLVEAVLLTVAGGAAGSILGAGVSYAIAWSSGWAFHIEPFTLALGPAVAGAMGLVFGLYPALSAARLNPIEALRAD